MIVEKKDLRRRAGLLTLHDMAETLGISYWSLYHHITVGHVARPKARIKGRPRRYYVEEDVERLRTFFHGGK
jgi:predicted site-specific integrase-resolvase